MLRSISKSLWLLTFAVVLLCGIYPAILWAIGQTLWPFQVNGSIVNGPDGKPVGSLLVAQPFTKDEYFQPRPSAASYDGTASSSSALAVSNYALRDRVAADLVSTTVDIVGRAEQVLSAAQEVRLLLPGLPPPAQTDAIADINAQLDRLMPPGFVSVTGRARLADLTRYLTAIRRRLERLPHAIGADQERLQRVQAVQDAYDELVHALPPARARAADVRDSDVFGNVTDRYGIGDVNVVGSPALTGSFTSDPSPARKRLLSHVAGELDHRAICQ